MFWFSKFYWLACWFTGGTSPDTENDFLLAQMIQLEYDKEYDRTIDSMEKRYNGESKGIYTCQFVNGVSMHTHVGIHYILDNLCTINVNLRLYLGSKCCLWLAINNEKWNTIYMYCSLQAAVSKSANVIQISLK